eukprot:Rmarinus@m.27814
MQRRSGSTKVREDEVFATYDISADLEACALSIVIIGASGDLSKRKIFPSLFTLYDKGYLPEHTTLLGYSLTQFTDDEFRDFVRSSISNREACSEESQNRFLQRCFYRGGEPASKKTFREINNFLEEEEMVHTVGNRIFFFAIPPSAFADTARAVGAACFNPTGWNRLLIEKPFGHDAPSSAQLSKVLREVFSERHIYRIDHYLGKEMVQNLIVLRFANLIFEPIWNRTNIASVQIVFKEDIGVDGRGAYFDQYGIICDVMQNHLLQMVALVAMEPPIRHTAEEIRNEKVKVLRCIDPVAMDDVVLGQYKADRIKSKPGYTDDPTVPNDSVTATFAAAVLHVKNRRWDGVPFLVKCGKGLDERKAEIRFTFRDVPGGMFGNLAANELVMRIQPDEAVYFRVMNKVPGLNMRVENNRLDLTYKSTYVSEIPDAYERLLLDAALGNQTRFIRDDELEAAWHILTPVLNSIKKERIRPEKYSFGSRGPASADYLVAKYDAKWSEDDEQDEVQ